MRNMDKSRGGQNTAQEIFEQTSAIALRVFEGSDKWIVKYITKNIERYGYNSADFLGGNIGWAEVVHPEDIDGLKATIASYEERHLEQYSLVYRIISGGGDAVWVHDLSTLCYDEEGVLLYTDSVITDYTVLKENQDRLEDHAKQLEVLNDILIGLHDSDPDKAFRIILDRTGKYLGISRVILFEDDPRHITSEAVYEWCNRGISSLIEDAPYRLSYEDDIPEIAADLADVGMRAVNFGDIPKRSEGEFKNEGVIAAAIYAVELQDERYGFICFDECVEKRVWEKNTLHFLETVSRMVSTALMRRKSADAIRSSQVVMNTVLDNVPSYIYVIDPLTRDIVFANETYHRDFPLDKKGQENTEDLSQKIDEYCFSRDAWNCDCAPMSFEIHLRESERWFSVQCNRIPWSDGREMRLFNCLDITEKKEQDRYIQRIAYIDHLTGLPNRYRCDIDLSEAIEAAQATGQSSYVLFIDMDDFKIVNDGYGHDYGDALLIEFANFLMNTNMPGNKVFRFGGDEFVLLIDPDNARYIEEIINTLLRRARRAWAVIDKTFYCTISVGVVGFPDGNMGVKEIIKNADIAMYEAKRIGKNSVAFYSDSMRNDSLERAEMESMMRESITKDFKGFVPFFQPYVDTHTGKMIGAEALMRWFPGNVRPIMPGSFIALAEYLGLIIPLGKFMLRESALFLKSVNDAGFPDFTISVNISIRQLQQQDIINQIEAVLEETKVNPKNLVFEITEGMAVTDLQRIQIICGELHKKGIHIAMDDFGTGYSSLSNLRDMPIDIIKIDKSFVQNVAMDTYSHSFIRLITDFGHSVGKQICIEGVETMGQVEFCKETDADLIQGFFFYRPMPGEELLDILKSNGE